MPSETAEQKQALSQASDRYKAAIEGQVNELKQDAFDIGKKVAIIGGACLAVYLLVQLLSDDDQPKKSKRSKANNLAVVPIQAIEPVAQEDKGDSMIWSAVKGIALSLLLSLAKEKLTELLAHLNETNAETNS